MKVIKFLTDFIKSKEVITTYNDNNSEYILFKKNLNNSNLNIIYQSQSKNIFGKQFTYVCATKNNEIVSYYNVDNNDIFLEEIDSDLKKLSSQYLIQECYNEIEKKIFEYVEKENTILDEDKLVETAEFYELHEPKFKVLLDDIHFDENFLYNFFCNREKMIESKTKKIIEDNEKEYKKFLKNKKYFEKFKETLKIDPVMMRKKALFDFITSNLSSNHLSNYKIEFTGPDNVHYVKNIEAKNTKEIINDLIHRNVLNTIPILAINNINKIFTTEPSVVYNTNDFPKITYNIEEKTKDFIEQKHYDKLSKNTYNDKEIMHKIILLDTSNFKLLSDELKSDEDYVIDLIVDLCNNNKFYLKDLEIDLENVEFFEKLFDRLEYNEKTRKYISLLLEKITDKYFTVNNIERFIDKHIKLIKIYLNRIDKEILNSKEFINFFKNFKNDCNPIHRADFINDLCSKINNPDVLISLYGVDYIVKNSGKYNNDVQKLLYNDKEYTKFLLDTVNRQNINFVEREYIRLNSFLSERYFNDFEMIKKIIRFYSNPYVFLKEMTDIRIEKGIPKLSMEEMFELSSINILCTNLLKDENAISLYLCGEISSFSNVKITDYAIKKLIDFDTEYCTVCFEVSSDNKEVEQIKFFDNDNHILTVKKDYFEDIIQTMKNEMSERYPGVKCETLYDIARTYLEKMNDLER